MADRSLTADRLRELVSYDPDTGLFTWIMSRQGVKAGSRAGGMARNGYIHFRVDGTLYGAHRLAWLYCHGGWPDNHVDHVNGVRHDNRIANLRDVTNAVNQQNQRKARNGNASGRLGVHYNPKRGWYQSSIRVNGDLKYLGIFKSADEAHAAYVSAKRMLHEGCTI